MVLEFCISINVGPGVGCAMIKLCGAHLIYIYIYIIYVYIYIYIYMCVQLHV